MFLLGVAGCLIPVADDLYSVGFLGYRTRAGTAEPVNLTYIVEEGAANGNELPTGVRFGRKQTWQQREESFVLKPSMKVRAWYSGAVFHGLFCARVS